MVDYNLNGLGPMESEGLGPHNLESGPVVQERFPPATDMEVHVGFLNMSPCRCLFGGFQGSLGEQCTTSHA